MMNDKEVLFHNARAEKEGKAKERLGFVYRSLGNILSFPLDNIPDDAKSVLEIGCFTGASAEILLKRDFDGKRYIGIDVSDTAIKNAKERINDSNQRIQFLTHDAHELTKLNQKFDYIFGNGILHHLNIDVALEQINSVLEDGGKAVFLEPLVGPPWIRFFRRATPSLRTEDEHPLTDEDLAKMRALFKLEEKRFGFLAPFLPMFFLNQIWISKLFLKIDQLLAKSVARHYFWISVLELEKRA